MPQDLTPPPGAVFELAEQTVAYVRTAVGLVLDYTSDTLPLLDHYLGGVPRDQPATVELVAATAGAYFGEVVRKAIGGTWDAESPRPAEWRLSLTGGIVISPIGMAAEAMLHAPTEGYEGELEVPDAHRAFVSDALADKEVAEDEYYSLSGRLETLLYVADLIAGRVSAATRSEDPDEPDRQSN